MGPIALRGGGLRRCSEGRLAPRGGRVRARYPSDRGARQDTGGRHMRHRLLFLTTALLVALATCASLAFAAAERSGTGRKAETAAAATIAPPAVANAGAIKARYGGQTITFIGDNGISHKRDLKLMARFSKDTGIKVKLIPQPLQSDASYSQK